MKLFKAYNNYISSEQDVVVVFAENKFSVLDYLRKKDFENTKKYVKEELNIDFIDFLNEFGKAQNEAFKLLRKCNLKGLVTLYWNTVCMDEWTIEEVNVPKNSDVFACFPDEIDNEDDVRIVFVPLDTYDTEDFVYTGLSEQLASEDYYRHHVEEVACNAGLCETFHKDNGRYIFNDVGESFDVHRHIIDRFGGDRREINKYIDNVFSRNVKEFFKDEIGYADEYLERFKQNADEHEFDEDFYIYCAKKEIQNGNYINYDIRRVEIA